MNYYCYFFIGAHIFFIGFYLIKQNPEDGLSSLISLAVITPIVGRVLRWW